MTKDESIQEALRLALEAIHSLYFDDGYYPRYTSYEPLKIERAAVAIRMALKPKRMRKTKGENHALQSL
jgi:hypothetical protein